MEVTIEYGNNGCSLQNYALARDPALDKADSDVYRRIGAGQLSELMRTMGADFAKRYGSHIPINAIDDLLYIPRTWRIMLDSVAATCLSTAATRTSSTVGTLRYGR